MFCIAQFRYASNGNKLGNLTAWFVFDLGLQGIFMLVLRFAARRASGWRTAQPFVCPTSVARQYFILPGTANFLRRLNPAVQSALTWGVRARD